MSIALDLAQRWQLENERAPEWPIICSKFAIFFVNFFMAVRRGSCRSQHLLIIWIGESRGPFSAKKQILQVSFLVCDYEPDQHAARPYLFGPYAARLSSILLTMLPNERRENDGRHFCHNHFSYPVNHLNLVNKGRLEDPRSDDNARHNNL
jgi:hypothetical protein